jgi:hypothetical protein
VFLGCSVGNDKTGLGDVKTRLGAKNSEGASCNLSTRSASPVTDRKGNPLTSVAAIGRPAPTRRGHPQQRQDPAGQQRPHRVHLRVHARAVDRRRARREAVPDLRRAKGLLTAKFTTSGDVCDENLPFDKADEITGCKRVQA